MMDVHKFGLNVQFSIVLHLTLFANTCLTLSLKLLVENNYDLK